MPFEKVPYPKLSVDPKYWEPKYYSQRSYQLPAGYAHAYTAVVNRPNSHWLGKGVTHINVNHGAGRGDLAISQSGDFIFNPDPIKLWSQLFAGGKHFTQFTEDDCRNCANFVAQDDKIVGVMTSGMQEWNDSNRPWGQLYDEAPQQTNWLDRYLAAAYEAKGGKYYGRYNGCNGWQNLYYSGNTALLRQAYANNNTLLQVLKEYNGGGGGDGFFRDQLWRYRPGLLNQYLGSADPSKARITAHCLEIEMALKGLAAEGVPNHPMMSFKFLQKREFPGVNFGYSAEYNHEVAGGVVTGYNFTPYSARYHVAQAFLAYALGCKVQYDWEDTVRRGTDPNIIQNDEFRDWLGIWGLKYYGPGNPARKGTPNVYDPSGAGYLEMQYGPGHDANAVGIEWFCRAHNWAGSKAGWAANRIVGQGSFGSNNATYLLDRSDENMPISLYGAQSNRRWTFLYDLVNKTGTEKEYEVQVPGGTAVVQSVAGTPYLLFGEV